MAGRGRAGERVRDQRHGSADEVRWRAEQAAYEGGRVLIARRGAIICAVISFNELNRLRALPPEPDPQAEAERFWQEGKRALEEKLQRLAAERAAQREAEEARRKADEPTGVAERG